MRGKRVHRRVVCDAAIEQPAPRHAFDVAKAEPGKKTCRSRDQALVRARRACQIAEIVRAIDLADLVDVGAAEHSAESGVEDAEFPDRFPSPNGKIGRAHV